MGVIHEKLNQTYNTPQKPHFFIMQRYEVLTLIGEGAYGSVYKARRKCNNEMVAIKKFKDNIDKTNNHDIKRTIIREIKMLRKLQNFEYVVQLQDQYKRRGRIHLVFEYIDQSLLNLLEANPAGLSDKVVNNLLVQLLNAIEWCHQNKVIHRDIKPENLLVDSGTNNLKLCDFGFARNMQKDDEEPVTAYVATRWYRAPELLVGTNRHTTAVDIWPVGCIWVEMCSSEPLFPGDSEIDQIYIIQEGLGHPLPQPLLNFFSTNDKYAGLNLPKPELYSKDTTSSLNKRIRKQHQVSYQYFQKENRLVLLGEMLKLDPDTRVGISDAIKFIETGGKSFLENRERMENQRIENQRIENQRVENQKTENQKSGNPKSVSQKLGNQESQKFNKSNKLRSNKSLTKINQNYEKQQQQNYDTNYDKNYEIREKIMKINPIEHKQGLGQGIIQGMNQSTKSQAATKNKSTKNQSKSTLTTNNLSQPKNQLNQHKKLYKAKKNSSNHNIIENSTSNMSSGSNLMGYGSNLVSSGSNLMSSGSNITSSTSSSLKLPKMNLKCNNKSIVGNSLLLDLLDPEDIYEDEFEDKMQ